MFLSPQGRKGPEEMAQVLVLAFVYPGKGLVQLLTQLLSVFFLCQPASTFSRSEKFIIKGKGATPSFPLSICIAPLAT
jgi:hypothetical protein